LYNPVDDDASSLVARRSLFFSQRATSADLSSFIEDFSERV
jgi:hypothetical protein